MTLTRPHVLVVEDDRMMGKFLVSNLKVHGYVVTVATDGREAMEVVGKTDPDLVLLDLMIPKLDGFEVCRRLRESSTVPILILTARGDESDKVVAFNLGADDYLTKPFGVEELLARIKAVLRRAQWFPVMPMLQPVEAGDVRVDLTERTVWVSGKPVKLTPTEFELLKQLVTNLGKVLTHSLLLRRVWGPEYGDESEYLRVYIGRLRHKIECDPAKPKYILTEPGVGYRFQCSK